MVTSGEAEAERKAGRDGGDRGLGRCTVRWMELPAELAERYTWVERGRVALLLRTSWREALPLDAMLAGAGVDAWGDGVAHELTGRAEITVVRTSRGELVGKSITRGGLLGGLARRHFLRGTRVVDEALLGEQVRAAGIDTPKLVVARVTRTTAGLVTLDVATERLAGALDLVDAVAAGASASALARASGRLLRRLHDVGLRHRDLHVKNVLAPAELLGPEPTDGASLAVLDLDGCTFNEHDALSEGERVASVARFGRSAAKRNLVTRGGAALVRDFVHGYAGEDLSAQRVVLHAIRRARSQVARRQRLGRY